VSVESVLEAISHHKIVAIVRAENAEEAWESGSAVIEGGLPIVEVSLNTPGALSSIAKLASQTEGIIGAGTVLTVTDVAKVVDAGAQFVVTPNFNPDVVSAVREAGLVVGPGVFTATESHQALTLGAHLLKLFPASSAGVALMRSLRGPFPSARWLPTGGISPENLAEWLEAGAFGVGMGSALTKGHPDHVRALATTLSQRLSNAPSTIRQEK